MIDYETFLTEIYAIIDDYCKSKIEDGKWTGPPASLNVSEIVTLAIAGQWAWFGSERGFYRYLCTHFRSAFPGSPHRSQLNRLIRAQQEIITAFVNYLVHQIAATQVAYEALDASAVLTRHINRRGRGWLPGLTDYGKSNRLGFYQGFHFPLNVNPIGVITGYGFGLGHTSEIDRLTSLSCGFLFVSARNLEEIEDFGLGSLLYSAKGVRVSLDGNDRIIGSNQSLISLFTTCKWTGVLTFVSPFCIV
jgi:hypothetical protein